MPRRGLRDANRGAIKQASLLGGRITAFDDDDSEAKERNTLGTIVAGFISRPVIVSFKIERTIRLCFDWVDRRLTRRPTAS
jgi:hypothetical protein